jgi:preprotein translocase subunit SecE
MKKVMLLHAHTSATKGSSSTGQSSGLQNRRLGVQVPPALRRELVKTRSFTEREEGDMSEEVRSEEKNFFQRIPQFYRQVLSELRRVVWPTRKQVSTYTTVVMVFVTFMIGVISIFDLGLTKIVFWVFGG